MTKQNTWYSRIPESDRVIVDAAALWLKPVSWQWFVTLTFTWNVRSETADLKLKQWLNTLEQQLKSRICFVAGKERKPHSHGMEVPWHFHLLVTSTVVIPKDLLESAWRPLARRSASQIGSEQDDDSVLVESYQQHRKGPEYCLKAINSCDGDWTFRWLEFFHPHMKQTSSRNHSKVRQRKRFAAKLQRDVNCKPTA